MNQTKVGEKDTNGINGLNEISIHFVINDVQVWALSNQFFYDLLSEMSKQKK